MKKSILSLIIVASTFSTYVSAYVNCDGVVENFQVDSNGSVQVTSNEIWGDETGRRVCSVGNEWKGVTTDACKAWVSMLLSARVTQQPILIQYQDGTACNTMPTWGNASAPNMIDTK